MKKGLLALVCVALLAHGRQTLLQSLFFCWRKRGFRALSECVLLAAFPVAPPQRCRAIKMGDICAVLLVWLGCCGAAVQFAVINDFSGSQAVALQNALKGLQDATHGEPHSCRGFQ